jgi:hypothetical protein
VSVVGAEWDGVICPASVAAVGFFDEQHAH